MSTDRDMERITRSWLQEEQYESANRVLDVVLDLVDTTPQRRAWRPAWRFPHLNRSMQAVVAAAAMLVLLIAGYSFLPRTPGSGGPIVLPSPSPTPRPIPTGSMAAGRYVVTDPKLTLVPYTFTAPAGWTGGDGALRGDMDGTGVRLTTWIITHVYTNSCHWTGTLVPVTDRAALVAALTAQVGHTHSTPVETMIGGLPATKITFSLDNAFDVAKCDSGIVRLWPDPGPDESGGWPIHPGHTTTVFVIEAKGKVMVLMTVQHKDSPAADVAALQQILASVEFQP